MTRRRADRQAPGWRPPIPLAAFLAALLLLPAGLGAQSRSIRFERLSLEAGLSQVTVNCILQDRVGFLWLGTQNGLNRYDGYRFEVYKHDPADPTSLPNNWITALREDGAGDLWIGTDGGGIVRRHRAADAFIRFRHDPEDSRSLSGDRVRSLLVDRLGHLWIGTFDSGLDRFDPGTGTFDRFRHDPGDSTSLGGDRIRAIYEDHLGDLWVGTDNGLSRLDRGSGSFSTYRHDPADPASLSDDAVLSIVEDHAADLWIGTQHGLNRLHRASGRFERYLRVPSDPASLSHDRVRALWEDRGRRLWIGTDGGLDLLADPGGKLAHYRHDIGDPTSLSDDRVMAIFQDRAGVLWIATQGAGLNKWDPKTWSFSHYRADGSIGGLSNNNVFALSEDAEGRLWIGTSGGGLNVFDRSSGQFKVFRHDPEDPTSLGDDRISALLHDRRGNLWVGTLASGVSRLDAAHQRFEHYRHDPRRPGTLSHDAVAALYEDRRETLWVGTYGGGLNRFDRDLGTFESFRHLPADSRSLSNDRTICFAEDGDGRLWIGTFGGGLDRFDPGTEIFVAFRHDPKRAASLSNDTVMALHFDPSGTLWIGTQEGLNRLQGIDGGSGEATFERFYERDGLPANVIYGIHSEPGGALWISSVNGLSRFDPQLREFTNYNVTHGLQSNEFNFGAHFQSRTGELFFGGVNGFNAFYPDRIERNTTVPNVVLTGFSRMNEAVRPGRPLSDLDEVTLSYRDTFFAFEFAALDFAAPEENRYRYRLEGADDRWVSLGGQRRVSFFNLAPGRYRLRVQGSNNDGVWNREGIALRITVTPPFWRTWWFRALGLLALAAGAFGAYELKIRSVRRNAERLETQVRERTRELEEAQEQLLRRERLAALGEVAGSVAHEIRNPLGVIKNSVYFLRLTQKGVDDKGREHLGLIESEIDRSDRIITELLDFARSPTLETRRFALQEALDRALAGLEVPDAVTLERQLGEAPLTVEADPGQIERILSNLLANAVQAMPEGGELRIECRRRGGEAVAEIADTGVGIEEERLAKIFEPLYTSKAYGIGLGLALSQRYAQLNQGRIECASRPGRGTTFRLVLPLVEAQEEP